MLSANSYILLNTEVLVVQNVVRYHPLLSYPPQLYYIAKYQNARNSIIHIYHKNQFNTRVYSTAKQSNIIDLLQDELILAGGVFIDIYEEIGSQ